MASAGWNQTAFSHPFIQTKTIHLSHRFPVHHLSERKLCLNNHRYLCKKAIIVQALPPSADASKPSSAPQQIQDANILIVGGGPCGSLAGMLLHQRGIPATLIERNADVMNFDAAKTYSMGIIGRGWKAASAVPGLLEYIRPYCISTSLSRFDIVAIDGSVASVGTNMLIPNRNTALLYRFRLLQVFKSFLQERTDVATMYGSTLEHIDFKEDGTMHVTVKDNNGLQVLKTRLILACDGKNSVVLKYLREAQNRATQNIQNVQSIRGFEERSLSNPSVGIVSKGIVLDQKSLENSISQSIQRMKALSGSPGS